MVAVRSPPSAALIGEAEFNSIADPDDDNLRGVDALASPAIQVRRRCPVTHATVERQPPTVGAGAPPWSSRSSCRGATTAWRPSCVLTIPLPTTRSAGA